MELSDAEEQLEIQRKHIQELQKKHDRLLQEEEDELEFVWSVPMKNVKVCHLVLYGEARYMTFDVYM